MGQQGKWTQTPEGRKRLAVQMLRRLRGSKGKAHLAKMAAGRTRYYEQLRQAKANGTELPQSEKAQRSETGRQMLVALAREGALTRRAKLLNELEKLDLFLSKTGGSK